MATERIRVVLVDDHPLYLAGVRGALVGATDVEVVGSAVDAKSGLALVLDLAPNVVLLDPHLPDGNGLDVIRAMSDKAATTAVIVLTMLNDSESLFAAMRAGARGYLVKGSDAEEIIAAVRIVADGGAVFGPAVAERMLETLTAQQSPDRTTLFPELTDRERETLVCLAEGRSNAAIATYLGLSPKTVRNYVSSIFVKLHAVDRTEVIIRARDAGLGRGSSHDRGGGSRRT